MVVDTLVAISKVTLNGGRSSSPLSRLMSSATKDLSRLELSGLTQSAPEPIVLKAPTNALTSRLFVALLHWRTVSQWCVMLYRHLSNVMLVHYVVKNLQYGSWKGFITQWPFRQFAVSCSMTNCWLETFRLHVNYNTTPSSNVWFFAGYLLEFTSRSAVAVGVYQQQYGLMLWESTQSK